MLVYIHGANATSESFNYLREHIGGVDMILNYNSADGFKQNLALMQLALSGINNIFFIAHSLGGIYALHLSNLIPDQVTGAVTLSTPYGGAESADFAKYFLPFSRLLRDIGPASWPMRHADKIKIQHPWTNIVTIRGSAPWITGANDGIVTVASQCHHAEGMELVEIDYNHYEVVLSDQVVQLIQDRLPKNTLP
jgi:pimeloyl-ACP methyl ester carboxylesterase